MRILLTTVLPAFVVVLCLTPLFRRLAVRLGIVDHPDKERKVHAQATPLGGGVVILLAVIVTAIVAMAFSPSRRAELTGDVWFLIGGLAAAVAICLIGLLDDRFVLRGRQKLVGQFLAASVWLSAGLWFNTIQVFGLNIELGILAAPITLFWLMGAMNALNLLDGADGLATSVGIILSIAIAVMATFTGHQTEAFLALAMAGALAGFLVYNHSPASIFLGDAGSMSIGLVLGGLAIRSSMLSPTTVVLAAPLAIWAIPYFDVAMAILRRKLTGRSIYTTDHGHLHHLVQQRGFRGWKTAMVVGLLCSFTSVAAVASILLQIEWLAFGAIGIVIFTMIVSGFFGQQECLLLVQRAKHFVLTLTSYGGQKERHAVLLHMRLRGTRRWEELGETMTLFAERFDLSSIQLNLSMPAIDEEYHATWNRKEHPSDLKLWRSEIPLLVRDVSVGRLSIVAACHQDDVCAWMSDLIAGLGPFQAHLFELICETTDEETKTNSSDSSRLSSWIPRTVRSDGRARILHNAPHEPESVQPNSLTTLKIDFDRPVGGESGIEHPSHPDRTLKRSA